MEIKYYIFEMASKNADNSKDNELIQSQDLQDLQDSPDTPDSQDSQDSQETQDLEKNSESIDLSEKSESKLEKDKPGNFKDETIEELTLEDLSSSDLEERKANIRSQLILVYDLESSDDLMAEWVENFGQKPNVDYKEIADYAENQLFLGQIKNFGFLKLMQSLIPQRNFDIFQTVLLFIGIKVNRYYFEQLNRIPYYIATGKRESSTAIVIFRDHTKLDEIGFQVERNFLIETFNVETLYSEIYINGLNSLQGAILIESVLNAKMQIYSHFFE